MIIEAVSDKISTVVLMKMVDKMVKRVELDYFVNGKKNLPSLMRGVTLDKMTITLSGVALKNKIIGIDLSKCRAESFTFRRVGAKKISAKDLKGIYFPFREGAESGDKNDLYAIYGDKNFLSLLKIDNMGISVEIDDPMASAVGMSGSRFYTFDHLSDSKNLKAFEETLSRMVDVYFSGIFQLKLTSEFSFSKVDIEILDKLLTTGVF